MFSVILIATLFYVPFHIAPPVLLAFLYGRDDAERRRNMRDVLIESLLTMTVALGGFFWLWEDRLGLALAIMGLMMAWPYWRIWRYRCAANAA